MPPGQVLKTWFNRFLQRILVAVFGFAMVLFGSLVTSQAIGQQVIKPEGKETTVTGTIRLIHPYGPPGYGEDPKHDSRVSYWAIEVPVPLNTPCSDSDFGCDPAKRLKLFFPDSGFERLNESPAAKWKDQPVIVHGKLHHADTAGEMTPIYMDVTSIESQTPDKTRKP